VVVLDSAQVTALGEFVFRAAPVDATTHYQLKFQGGSPVVFMASSKDRLNMVASATEFLYGKALVNGSTENQVFFGLEEIRQRNVEAQRISGTEYDALDYFSPKYNSLADEIRKRYDEVLRSSNIDIKELQRDYQGTFGADVMSGFYYNLMKEEEIVTDTMFDNNLAFQHHHYFDRMDFSDVRAASLSIVYDRIDEYMGNYVETRTQGGLRKGIDILMRKVVNPDVRSAIALYMSRRLKKQNEHDMAEYVLDTYYSDKCEIAQQGIWDEVVEEVKLATTGSLAPEIDLPGIRGENYRLSGSRGKKATILYFWSTRCPYCTEALPEMADFYQAHYDYGLEIYAVSLDDDRDLWKLFMEANNLPWVNVCEGKGTKSETSRTYGLRGTPTYLLLDSRMHIVLRTHNLNELLARTVEHL
jgi:peroxiredoxin